MIPPGAPPSSRALVTGASRGIGAAIAAALGAAGRHVIVNFRTGAAAAQRVVDGIIAAGGSAEAAGFDVVDFDATRAAIAKLLEDPRPIDVVVNNAGLARDAVFPAMTAEAWSTVTRTTLDGFFNVTQPLVMPMVRRRHGRIINVASVSGVIGNRGQVNYSAAKAGLIGATRALSRELSRKKITVNAVAPGLVDTEMLQGLPIEEALKFVPMNRLGKPEEVAALVAFLASEAAGYITGQVIGMDGGLS
jgi:3-oxoacyl-[acyl-carrier protein] reductase